MVNVPLILTVLVVLAIWLLALGFGRVARRRGDRRYEIAGLVVTGLAGAGLAVALYLERAAGVPVAQGVEGAAWIACPVAVLPLASYFEIGYRVERLRLAAGIWVFAAPCFLFAAAFGLLVGGLTLACAPGA